MGSEFLAIVFAFLPGEGVYQQIIQLRLVAQGKFAEAAPLYERSLAINTEVYGPDHPGNADGLIQLAVLLGVKVRPTIVSVRVVVAFALGPLGSSVHISFIIVRPPRRK